MTELWHWIERLGGGLAALLFLGLVMIYLPVLLRWLSRLFCAEASCSGVYHR